MTHFLKRINGKRSGLFLKLMAVTLLCTLIAAPLSLAAQEDEKAGQIQVLTGRLFNDEKLHFKLPEMQQGDILYVELSNVSGNLDPILFLSTPDAFTDELLEEMRAELAERVAAGDDEVKAMQEILLGNFLIANDNFGGDSTAAFTYQIPEDGEYLLLAMGALTNETAGDYKLVVGLDAPEVLSGRAAATGDTIAYLDKEASNIATAVQEISGELTAAQHNWAYTIPHVDSGETLYAYVEATSGNLLPVLELEDYSGRTLRHANATGQQRSAVLEFSISALTDNFKLTVTAWDDEGVFTAGEYRLVVGTNEPEVLSGEAEPTGRDLVAGAQPVIIHTELQQITGVDQQSENYGGVYYLQMDWHDDTQAFNPDDCLCDFKTFIGPGYDKLVSDENLIWPAFTIFNQQNNRWIQNQGIIVEANGDMRYFERFTTTLQAPDFNFRSFPFDSQQFYLHVDALYPQTYFKFVGPKELSTLGDQLGEEEWQVTEYSTEISSQDGLGEVPSSRFSFGFQAHRHLNFYVMRIFLPTLLIIMVSYFTFFLKDYSKRIDVTSANLLVFVAFNFTISDDLPRLGYLTFLDAMLASVFVVTALVIAFNVFLRRMELNGQEERARKIDSYTLWVYPALYIIGAVVLTIYFLMPEYWDRIVGTIS